MYRSITMSGVEFTLSVCCKQTYRREGEERRELCGWRISHVFEGMVIELPYTRPVRMVV
ncbi:MAG: hypothetical protein UV38_C0002G0036 [candidate division TM6 bacterium GW2011_GWE2_42_60]|nr:MAG: hypothetical protein UV38_C0002G0036 [candidate division TM6 bacterium GW2011_GWE2_42_60]